jgi:hypothetical protein
MNKLEHTAVVILIGLVPLWTGVGAGVAEEIGYVEDFALAPDRTVALRQLVPGTEEFYYYHCLHYQNTGELDRVEPLVQAWIHRHQVTPRVREIQNRQALLMFRSQPDQTLDYLQRTLNLQFHHQRETAGPRPDLPSRLDPALLDPERLTQEALRTHENLDGFEDSVLESLMARELTPARLRQLLERLTRPDHPQLVPLVMADLVQPDSAGFGSLAIHRLLLLDQLDVCLALKPDLLNRTEFVHTYLAKLQPNDDVDLRTDVVAEQAHVERLWSFAERLAPAHNSLKAHLFYHRLRFDLRQGLYDQPRFMAYIALPRVAPYVNPRYIEPEPMRRVAADLQADFAALTRLPPVMDDEPLIRAYLQHFFLTDTNYKAYEPYLNDVYLKHLFAETKLVHGVGDAEQWSALLPPEMFQALKQRVDLDFSPSSRRQFAAEDPIEVELFVKNVPTLIVKVFEINTFNHYRQTLSEVNTDINLDGLMPNQEQTYQYDEPELRRVARRFEFPELDRTRGLCDRLYRRRKEQSRGHPQRPTALRGANQHGRSPVHALRRPARAPHGRVALDGRARIRVRRAGYDPSPVQYPAGPAADRVAARRVRSARRVRASGGGVPIGGRHLRRPGSALGAARGRRAAASRPVPERHTRDSLGAGRRSVDHHVDQS